MIEENALNIYTDGSSFSRPRRGGIGIRLLYVDQNGNEELEDIPEYKSYPGATNNQMELYACITSLEEAIQSRFIDKVSKIIIFTDSRYVADNYINALFYWPKYHWLTKEKNPVLNAKLWIKLTKISKKTKKRVEIRWIKGHSKDIHNKAVDKLAKQSAKSPLMSEPLSIINVRRKKTDKKVNLHSVEMKGQKLVIRIITDEYLETQRTNRYKYEVTSENSKFYGNVDIIYSDVNLKAGHEYCVTLNKDTYRPRISRLINEVK